MSDFASKVRDLSPAKRALLERRLQEKHRARGSEDGTRRSEPRSSWSVVVPIQPAGARDPFFCVSPIMGTVFPYFELARHLGGDQPFYGLQPPALAGEDRSPIRIEDLAACFIDGLREIRPSGPYHLGGWSFGTLVTYEMARQLAEQGDRVGLVALLDAPAPVRSQRPSLIQGMRLAFDIVALNLWPYVWDYLYLASVSRRPPAAGEGSSSSRRRRFLARLRTLGSLRSLVKGAAIARVVPPESRSVLHHAPQIRAMFRALNANSRAMASYVPQPYPGCVTLFRTGEHTGKDRDLGWGELAAGKVEVRKIPGNHMTLLRAPHVEVFARELRASLDEARNSGRSTSTS